MQKQKVPLAPVIGCLLSQLCVGVVYLWSVFRADAMTYFHWALSPANLVSSFMVFGFCAGSFAGGALNVRFGAKRISLLGIALFCAGLLSSSLLPQGTKPVLFYLTYCTLGGIGVGFTFNSGLFCLQSWFPHRRGFASGLGTAAFGLGSVVFSPVISTLLREMTISATLRVLAIGVAVVGFGSCLLIRAPGKDYLAALPHTEHSATDAARDMPFREAFRTVPFWCMVGGLFFYNAAWNVLTPLVKGLGIARGLSQSAAVICVSLTGVFNAAGRLVMSTLSDRLGRIRTVYVLSGITTVCALLLTFIGGAGYFATALLTVFAFGGPAAVFPAACTDLFGQKYSGTNYGFGMLALGLSSIVFNAVSNALFTATGAYVASFLVCAASALLTVVFYAIIQRCLKKGFNR